MNRRSYADPGAASSFLNAVCARELAAAMSAARSQLCCTLVRVEVDFERHRAVLHLPESECTDMTGAIDYCRAIDPDVRSIQTMSGHDPDTLYQRSDGEWLAISHGAVMWRGRI